MEHVEEIVACNRVEFQSLHIDYTIRVWKLFGDDGYNKQLVWMFWMIEFLEVLSECVESVVIWGIIKSMLGRF